MLPYYIVLFLKMEVFFAVKDKLFTQSVQKTKRKQAKGDKMKYQFYPEIPQRTQNLAAGSEEKGGAAQKTDELIDPQFTASGTQGEEKQQGQHQQTIENIQSGSDDRFFAPQTYCPQQVVQQAQCPAQQRGLQRKTQLQETIDLHTAAFQPKSRCRKPRWDSCSS